MYNVEVDYLEAIAMVAALEDRLTMLAKSRRREQLGTEGWDLFYQMGQQTARALARVRVAALLDTDLTWTEQKVWFDAEQRVDNLESMIQKHRDMVMSA